MNRKLFLYTLLGLTILLLPHKTSAAELVTNGGFETGNFTGWTVNTGSNAWQNFIVTAAGGGATEIGITASSPIQGSFSAHTGFCCNTVQNPEYIQQQVTIPTGFFVRLTWSDKIQSNLRDYCTAANCGTNTWRVQILNTSNVLLQTLYTYTAGYSTTIHQTGWVNHQADLTPYAGQTIRLRFSATYSSGVSGNMNGPGRAEVDAVSVQTLQPTAANVSVGGRILTQDGQGIYHAYVTLTDSAGNSRTVLTSGFGYYSFDNVGAGEIYTISVTHKRYEFANNPRVLNVQDNLADEDFIATP